MGLVPLASRAFKRTDVSNWLMNARHSPEDLINELIEARDGSLENFRAAVAARETPPYLGSSNQHVTWCCPTDDLSSRFEQGMTGLQLLAALGTTWKDAEVIELLYPASTAEAFYKPCAVAAGANPLFRYTSPEEEYGLTVGGIREMIHAPLKVVDALGEGAALRQWP
jgi:hypothetical protein